MTDEEFLKHYGILGMHWGKKKGSATTSIASIHRTHEPSEDHIKKLTLKTKKLHEMSNAELKALNERMNLEKQYKDLSKADISRGKKIIQDILNSAAKSAQDAAMEYVKKYAVKNIDKLMSKTVKG